MWQILLKTLTLEIVFNPLIPFLVIWTKEIIKGVNKEILHKNVNCSTVYNSR